MILEFCFFLCGLAAKLGLKPPQFWDFYTTHTQPVGLLWISDQPVAESSTYTTHNKHNRRNCMPSTGFEPAIPAVQRQQNDALENTATGAAFVVPALHQIPLRWLNENKDWRSLIPHMAVEKCIRIFTRSSSHWILGSAWEF